jgi:hypothetical protein
MEIRELEEEDAAEVMCLRLFIRPTTDGGLSFRFLFSEATFLLSNYEFTSKYHMLLTRRCRFGIPMRILPLPEHVGSSLGKKIVRGSEC